MFAPRWASKLLGGTRPHAAGLLVPFALTHGGPGLRGNPVGVHRPCLTDWMPLDDQKASKLSTIEGHWKDFGCNKSFAFLSFNDFIQPEHVWSVDCGHRWASQKLLSITG